MRLVRTTSLSLSLVSLLLAPQNEAEACSPPRHTPSRSVTPSDGSTAVPRNARIVVRSSFTPASVAGEAELRTASGDVVGASVEHDGEVVVITPKALLDGEENYEIFLRPQLEEGCEAWTESCFGSELARAAGFTTSSVSDTEPPLFSGDAMAGAGVHDICQDCTCDFDWHFIRYGLRWAEATDAGGEVLYNVYLDGELVSRLRRESSVATSYQCSGNDVESGFVASAPYGEGEYTAVAVDIAGNETTSVHSLSLGAPDCDAPHEPDAGVGPGAPDAGEGDGTRTSSCSVGGSATGSLGLMGLIVLLLAGRRRKRDC